MLGVYIHATHAKTPNGGIYHLNFLPVFILPFHGAYREEENQGEEGKTVYLVVPTYFVVLPLKAGGIRM
jgi:hypothetical protein